MCDSIVVVHHIIFSVPKERRGKREKKSKNHFVHLFENLEAIIISLKFGSILLYCQTFFTKLFLISSANNDLPPLRQKLYLNLKYKESLKLIGTTITFSPLL